MSGFREIVDSCPVIAAVKDDEGLDKCLTTDIQVVFVLYGDIITIGSIVDRIKEAGRIAMVHMDLIAGLATREISVDYIRHNTRADGIISTRPNIVKRAREEGLYTVMRFFVIDSMAYDNINSQCRSIKPDCIEILPGIMPKVIKKIVSSERVPVIAGGLISDKSDIMNALEAGAVAISSTNQDVWEM